MRPETLNIATCQFPISGDMDRNAEYVQGYMRQAAAKGANIVHFPETALSGYAGSCPEYGVDVFDVPSFRGYDWERLRDRTREIMGLSRELGIWVILGSTHYLDQSNKPLNCLYLISDGGTIRNRYDKRTCTPGDLKVYSPGSRSVTFTLKGFKCGLLICADSGNPPLYQDYQQKGVRVLFHAYYNARFNGPIPNDTYIVPEARAKAREYGMWIFANNSSARHSCWATFIAGPDGQFKKLRRHQAGILYQELRPADLPGNARFAAGTPSRHPRAMNGRSAP